MCEKKCIDKHYNYVAIIILAENCIYNELTVSAHCIELL